MCASLSNVASSRRKTDGAVGSGNIRRLSYPRRTRSTAIANRSCHRRRSGGETGPADVDLYTANRKPTIRDGDSSVAEPRSAFTFLNAKDVSGVVWPSVPLVRCTLAEVSLNGAKRWKSSGASATLGWCLAFVQCNGHREGELYASEHRRIQVHDRPPSSGARPMMTPAVTIARVRPPIATHKPNTPMMAKKKAMPITTVVSTPATFRETLDFGCDICHRRPSPIFSDAKRTFPDSFYIPRSQLMSAEKHPPLRP
jgi:hypothetical protein